MLGRARIFRLRRQPLVEQLEDERRRKPRRIDVNDPGVLWGVDLTLVWVLGFFPWGVGAVDDYGSRVVAFERCRGRTQKR